MPVSYFRRVLLDGAKPFVYRKGVRSLLGVPESDGGGMVFSPAMPPSGFPYTNPQFMEEPYRSPYPHDLTAHSTLRMRGVDRESNEAVPSASAHQSSLFHASARKRPNSSIEVEGDGAPCVMPPDVASQNIVGLASEQNTNVTKPSHTSQESSAVVEQVTLQVPGDSTRRQSMRVADAQHSTPAQIRARKNTDSAVSAAASEAPCVMPPGVALQHIVRPASEQTTNVTSRSPALQGSGIVVEKAALQVPDAPRKSSSSPPLSFSGQKQQHVNKTEEKFQHELPPTQSRPASLARVLSDARPINAAHSIDKLTQLNPGADHGASRTAGRIEQLRTAVRELAGKQSMPHGQTRSDETQSQPHQAPAPAQRVIIVKQPSTQTRIPHAFWERSYLSRIRTRILR